MSPLCTKEQPREGNLTPSAHLPGTVADWLLCLESTELVSSVPLGFVPRFCVPSIMPVLVMLKGQGRM
jgi:hypothetical protein